MENTSVQDNHIVKYTVDFEKQELVLYTKNEAKDAIEVVFSGLTAYLFEDTILGCVILDIEEWPVDDVIQYLGEDYITAHQKYDWPFNFTGLTDFKTKIAKRGLTIYNLASTYGMSGFIFAKSIKIIPSTR